MIQNVNFKWLNLQSDEWLDKLQQIAGRKYPQSRKMPSKLDFIANIKKRAAANDEAQSVLRDLKLRGVKVVDAIDTMPGLDDEDKESLAVVVGGIAVMTEAIEFCLETEGSTIGLKEAGLIESAKKTIARIDEVVSNY